jgi:hypothetical protein
MSKHSLKDIPRYYEPHVNDCFHNSYATVLSCLGYNPNLLLADYLSFMYDPETEYIGATYLYRYSTSVEFAEAELNTSLEFIYFPATAEFDRGSLGNPPPLNQNQIRLQMYVTDNDQAAYQRLKEMIDQDLPVVVNVDLYSMKYHRSFQREHTNHCVVITGYDETENIFELFDRFPPVGSNFDGTLTMAEVNAGRTSDCPFSNPMMGDYRRPIRNLWFEFQASPDFTVTGDKLISILKESYSRMTGAKKILGQPCGLEVIDQFRRDLMRKKEKMFDDRELYYFKTYLNMNLKSISRNRTRFKILLQELDTLFPGELTAAMRNDLSESATHWDIAANLALKMGIMKSRALMDDLDKHLATVKEIETRVVENLNSFVTNNQGGNHNG